MNEGGRIELLNDRMLQVQGRGARRATGAIAPMAVDPFLDEWEPTS